LVEVPVAPPPPDAEKETEIGAPVTEKLPAEAPTGHEQFPCAVPDPVCDEAPTQVRTVGGGATTRLNVAEDASPLTESVAVTMTE
jgi:hypothetical protein